MITWLYDGIAINDLVNGIKALPNVSLLIDLADQMTRGINLGVTLG